MGRRGAVGVVLLLTAATASGCGDSGPSGDEAAVRDTVNSFYTALERKDGKRACAAMSERARKETESFDSPRRPCEQVVATEFGGLPKPRIASMEIEGDKATVQLTAGGEGGSAILTRRGDAWLFESY